MFFKVDFDVSTILSTGELNRNSIPEDFCNSKGESCHKRSLYINRIRLPNINFQTGDALASDII